ncbi:MAG: hypothetical protein IJO78_05555 [Erysipelotrichaceae bacterium]|jgi:hypothetical protein|nr:hypothetical protein [Erysipelotrichaceae bacterium]MBQ9841042.1 hypothetical protein [Erysipelotrichaceae bacterium]MBR5795768.1 hypothetical protein [Erysipelotrichaceae bacterium]
MEIRNREDITYALMMRLNMLRRKELPHLSFQELMYVMVKGKWKSQVPVHSSVAISDIMETTAEEIVTILTRFALVEGGRMDISEFNDLLGGSKNEAKQ